MSTVIYELTRLISSDFFNFHKFISELNTGDFVPFFYKGPSTVKRRRLILTRRKSRESNKKSKPAVELSKWREKVFKQVEEKAANLKVTSKVQSFSNLHDNFVITQTDQANGNAAIICKFYILTLIKELGSNKTSNVHETYNFVIKLNKDQIIQGHSQYLQQNFKLEVIQYNKQFSSIYRLPELHTKPLKARYILAASKCSLKPLSKAITSTLKLLFINSKLQW